MFNVASIQSYSRHIIHDDKNMNIICATGYYFKKQISVIRSSSVQSQLKADLRSSSVNLRFFFSSSLHKLNVLRYCSCRVF